MFLYRVDLQSSRDKKTTVLTMPGDGRKPDNCGDHVAIYTNVESFSCTPEADIMSYVNYLPPKKKY